MTTTPNTTKASVTVKGRRLTVQLTPVGGAGFQVHLDGSLLGMVYPYQGLTGYWVSKQRGRARAGVAATKGRAAAIRDLINGY